MTILDQRIVNLLMIKGPMTTASIANDLSFKSATVGACLRRLMINGEVFKVGCEYTVTYGGSSRNIANKAFKPIFPMTSYYGR